mgnify:CR=1 FL=1
MADATRDEAIQWCIDNRVDFTQPKFPPPSGWMWADTDVPAKVLTSGWDGMLLCCPMTKLLLRRRLARPPDGGRNATNAATTIVPKNYTTETTARKRTEKKKNRKDETNKKHLQNPYSVTSICSLYGGTKRFIFY